MFNPIPALRAVHLVTGIAVNLANVSKIAKQKAPAKKQPTPEVIVLCERPSAGAFEYNNGHVRQVFVEDPFREGCGIGRTEIN